LLHFVRGCISSLLENSSILKTCEFIVYLNHVFSCTSLGGINIRMLGFVIQVISIYILRPGAGCIKLLLNHFFNHYFVVK
jgi:hypothetical protein